MHSSLNSVQGKNCSSFLGFFLDLIILWLFFFGFHRNPRIRGDVLCLYNAVAVEHAFWTHLCCINYVTFEYQYMFFFSPIVATINRMIILPLLVRAGSFHVSEIHRTLRWTARSLICVRDHSYACVYTLGLGTLTASRHHIFDSEKLASFSCAPDRV